MTTNLLITLCAALGVLVVLLAVLLVTRLRRSNREAEARVSGVVETLARRMEELATELAGLQSAISGRPIGQAGRLHISAGVGELKQDDDPITFFERADQALYRAKDAGKNRTFVADGTAA